MHVYLKSLSSSFLRVYNCIDLWDAEELDDRRWQWKFPYLHISSRRQMVQYDTPTSQLQRCDVVLLHLPFLYQLLHFRNEFVLELSVFLQAENSTGTEVLSLCHGDRAEQTPQTVIIFCIKNRMTSN